MAQATENLVNSQYTWEIATDGEGTVFNKVNFLTEMDMPTAEKATDDVTPSDAKSTVTAVADFKETSEITFTLVYMPTDEQHMALKAAYEDNSTIINKIKFTDSVGVGYQFDGMIKNFTLKPEQKKMLRVEGVLVVSSEITATV